MMQVTLFWESIRSIDSRRTQQQKFSTEILVRSKQFQTEKPSFCQLTSIGAHFGCVDASSKRLNGGLNRPFEWGVSLLLSSMTRNGVGDTKTAIETAANICNSKFEVLRQASFEFGIEFGNVSFANGVDMSVGRPNMSPNIAPNCSINTKQMHSTCGQL